MHLEKTFAVIKPDLSVDLAPVTETLYQQLDADYDDFRGHTLVAMHAFDADWGMWERHPAGDEIVVPLSGWAKLTLRTAAGNERVTLSEPGTYVVIPKDTWHTAHIAEPTRMLFITPGEGTENKESI